MRSGHLPLRVVLLLMTVGQIVGAVGSVGYLSFRNGQKAVNDLATQLRGELTARIERELKGYFETPHDINRLNASAFASGDLDVNRGRRGERPLYQQMVIAPNVAFVYCGSAQTGEFFGVLRSPADGSLQLSYSNPSTRFLRQFYRLDVRGNRTFRLRQTDQSFDSRRRPWFEAAVRAERPTWTDVYIAFTTGLPNVTASLPVYDRFESKLLGVCGTDVVLPEEFRSFLRSLQIGRSGQAFVVDRQGNLISNSTNEPLMVGQGQSAQPLWAVNSQDTLVRATADYLVNRFGGFDRIAGKQQLEFHLKGQRQFLEVLPFRDRHGLDWLIVVVVPESDFMRQIDANTRNTVLLCLVALVVAIALSVLTSRWITHPILRLSQASQAIAQGRLDQHIESSHLVEINELTDTFNSMAAQVKTSFKTLETQKNAFARFFPSEFLEFLQKRHVTEVALGDHVSKEMAILFSDIRLFTSLSERMTPTETFDFMNAYLPRVSPEIRKHRGFVVKFLGDGIMAVFPNGVDDAVRAGIVQQQQVQLFNQERLDRSDVPIQVGIGIHYGYVMVGMIGEPDRIQGDALSDTVNLTSRLEGLTKHYGVLMLISEQVLKRLNQPEQYDLRFLDRVIVQGRSEAIAIYEVLNAEPEAVRSLKQKTRSDFAKGWQCYQQGDLAAAKASFEQVLAIHPQDRTAQLYLERIEQFQREGVPIDWDGTWAFTHK